MKKNRYLDGLFSISQTANAGVSLSTTLGAAIILLLGVILLTSLSLERSRRAALNLLLEKGTAVMSALESGVRSGVRSREGMRFQFLVEELAFRPEVLFIAVTMPDGTILAHSNPHRVGDVLLSSKEKELEQDTLEALHITVTPAWKIMEMEGYPSFVVYKIFQPRRNSDTHHTNHVLPSSPPLYLFLGLDVVALKNAQSYDRKRALLFSSAILIVGMLALLALYALERFRFFKKRQQVAEALANELTVTLPDGVILLDRRGRIIRLNKAAQMLLDLEDDILMNPNENLLPPELANLKDRLLKEPILSETEIVLSQHEKTLHLNVRGGYVRDGNQKPLGSIIFLRDMTDIRRLEAEVRRREKLAAVGNLAAGVAHEIRNPLSSIKGYATYFGTRFPQGSPDQEAAHIMVQEVDRLNRVITELIGLSRPSDIRPRLTDMGKLLQDTLRLIEQDAATHNVKVNMNLAKNLPKPMIDPDRIRQVLLNLCLNAVQAMPKGGELFLSLNADSKNINLEVRDTGTGISATSLPHIFDPYFTTKGQGTGLGLATVHKIIEAHNGTISVHSDLEQGTSFHLSLPILMHKSLAQQ